MILSSYKIRVRSGFEIIGRRRREERRRRREEMEVTLNNGFQMPMMGLGVWRMKKEEIKHIIINAIKIGYRHFDCAGNTLFFSLFYAKVLKGLQIVRVNKHNQPSNFFLYKL